MQHSHPPGPVLLPRTAEELARRDDALRHPARLPGGESRGVHSSLALPDHAAA